MGKHETRIGIITLILILSIGFAAVTTNLLINGSATIGINANDFNVFFSYAYTSEGSNAIISNNKKEITFTGKTLMSKGDKATLYYTVKNDSSIYDASVRLSINVVDNSGIDHSEYYRVSMQGLNETDVINLDAKSAADGSITIELVKPYADEEFSLSFEVTIDADAVERTSRGQYQTINGTAYDSAGNILANTPMVMFSEPTYFTTDSEGHYEVTVPNGIHNAYYIPGATMEQLEEIGGNIKYDLRAHTTSIDTYSNTDIRFQEYTFGDTITINNQNFYYLGANDQGYGLLLAEYPLATETGLQSYEYSKLPYNGKKVRRPLATTIDYWNYNSYKGTTSEELIDEYVSKLHDDNLDIDHGSLLTAEQFSMLSGINIDSNHDYYDDQYVLDPDASPFDSRPWLIDSEYWLYDTIDVASELCGWCDINNDPDCLIDMYSDEQNYKCGLDFVKHRNYVITISDRSYKNVISAEALNYGAGVRPVLYVKRKQVINSQHN